MKNTITAQSKKQSLDKMSQKERGDYTLAIVEEMREGFKAMGEGFAGMHAELVKVRDRGEATFEEVGHIRVELNGVKDEIVEIKADIVEIKADIVEIKADIVEIKADIVEIKADIVEIKADIVEIRVELGEVNDRLTGIEKVMTTKADAKDLRILDVRVSRLEEHASA